MPRVKQTQTPITESQISDLTFDLNYIKDIIDTDLKFNNLSNLQGSEDIHGINSRLVVMVEETNIDLLKIKELVEGVIRHLKK